MKQLTLTAVKYAALLLIETGGKTSTLSVKLLLRFLGYEANQNDVSELMEQAAGELPLEFTTDGKYRTYTSPSPSSIVSDETTSNSADYQAYTKRNGDTVKAYSQTHDFSPDWWEVSCKSSNLVLYFDASAHLRDEVRQAYASLNMAPYYSTRAVTVDHL